MLLRRTRASLCCAMLGMLVLVAPATAQDRRAQAAAEALDHVEDLAGGRGVDTGRELTPALLELIQARPDMSASQRQRANRILARPTDPGDVGPNGLGPYTARSTSSCSAHFCVHWVEESGDAAAGSDADLTTVPPYVETVKATFEEAYAVQNGSLGWREPRSDGSRGGDSRVDVYLQDIGGAGLYGYASPDPQPTGRSLYAYLVLDNDYAEYGYADPLDPLEVTAAHEYNHVLQYAYDSLQDDWIFEATATWAEEKVFDGVNDYVNYLGTWADMPNVPITSGASDKVYGSAIFNHWLERRFGPTVVRRTWADSQANSVSSRGFAPAAYDAAIRASCGIGFSYELSDFLTATAEWDSPDSGIHEGATFPKEVARGTIAVDGATRTPAIQHTAYAVYTLTSVPTSASEIYLTGGIPGGTIPGSIALVGHRSNGTLGRALGLLDNDNGLVTVSLTDPGQYDRITAVIANTSVAHGAYNSGTRDWAWTGDAPSSSLKATATKPLESAAAPLPSFAPCTPVDPQPTPPPTATPSATPTPSPTVSATVTPTPTPEPPATSLQLTRNSTRISSVLRKGALSLFARTNKAGRMSALATVDRTTARRLKVGRRTTTAGTGRRTATAPARLKINVKLSRKVRAALKRHRNRALKLKVVVTLTPADGTRAVRRAITIKLRP